MSNKILFIFEGPRKENIITNSLTKFFVNDNTIVTCAYCTTIYKIYADIAEDEYLDTFSLVKDIESNKDILKNFSRSDFAQIYLFFDYDGHASNASDQKLNDLLAFFNEETEKGKLYISYPMVESLQHIVSLDTMKTYKVAINDFVHYKKFVSHNCNVGLKHITLYTKEIWRIIIENHLMRMNEVVNNIYMFPLEIIDQQTIFKSQLEKYIIIERSVVALSAFPIFLHDYYGNEEMKVRLKS